MGDNTKVRVKTFSQQASSAITPYVAIKLWILVTLDMGAPPKIHDLGIIVSNATYGSNLISMETFSSLPLREEKAMCESIFKRLHCSSTRCLLYTHVSLDGQLMGPVDPWPCCCLQHELTVGSSGRQVIFRLAQGWLGISFSAIWISRISPVCHTK